MAAYQICRDRPALCMTYWCGASGSVCDCVVRFNSFGQDRVDRHTYNVSCRFSNTLHCKVAHTLNGIWSLSSKTVVPGWARTTNLSVNSRTR